jgi:transposase
MYRFFTGHRTWKDFYKHIKCHHQRDFPGLPCYKSFLEAMNSIATIALFLLKTMLDFVREHTSRGSPKLIDSTKLPVCEIKREHSHKVCKGLARKSKGSMGWFYGFKLHAVCTTTMELIDFRITPGNLDDRKGMELMWENILGLIIADAGYVGVDWQGKASRLGKQLLTGVRKNMKKIMTTTQHQLLKLRQRVETMFSVLKTRFGLENTLPRSPKGYFAHYIWCLTSYQLDRLFTSLAPMPLIT